MTSTPKETGPVDSPILVFPDSMRPPPNVRLWIGGHNTQLRGQIDDELKTNPRPPTGPIDVAVITPLTQDEALYFVKKVRPRVSRSGTILILISESHQEPLKAGRLKGEREQADSLCTAQSPIPSLPGGDTGVSRVNARRNNALVEQLVALGLTLLNDPQPTNSNQQRILRLLVP